MLLHPFLSPSLKNHWHDTWVPTKNLLQNKKCLDVGIWKGILNYSAHKIYNCETIIGVEPFDEHSDYCSKILPDCKIYKLIEDIPFDIRVDVTFLHGVICLMGAHWKTNLNNLFSRVNSDILHIRHDDTLRECNGIDRETNLYDLPDYSQSPSCNQLKNYLESSQNYKLILNINKLFVFQK